jgi:putative membrane protein
MTGVQRLLLFLKGMCMGAADAVPGVSGGTIALIANIYDELLAAIVAVNPGTARLLITRGLRAAWVAINGEFLVILLSGILVSLVSLAKLVLYLLETHHAELMSFFVGLVLASLWYVNRQLSAWTLAQGLLLGLGLLLSVALAVLPPFQGVDSPLYYFFCGALAICAMILPGISGAFILLLLGAYETVLRGLISLDLPLILVFLAGCVTGLLSFARLLSWLLRHYRPQTLALLLGVLAGSIYKLWPWRLPAEESGVSATVTATVPAYVNISPWSWAAEQGGGMLLICLLLALIGFLLVWSLETLGDKYGTKSTSSGSQSGNSF